MSEPAGERRPAVVVPGNHDGVHRGHRALLDAARELAEPMAARVVALFFDPHPLAVLRPDRAPARLTMPARREQLLRDAGADEVAVQRFDRAFSELSPEQFVRELVERHGAAGVVVGPDFRFGHERRGDVPMLRELGDRHGMQVRAVGPVEHGGEPVSSSRVRRALEQGRVEEASVLLERVHEMAGTVVEGDRRGRTLGYPTANLQTEPVLAPADGIYAVVARRIDDGSGAGRGPRWAGAASLGERPTFEGAGRSVEVYLLDFDGDLYGAQLRVGFVARVRGEEKFDGVEELKRAMARDVQQTREAIAGADEEQLAWI